MALEGLINIRVYNSSGAIDASLSGSVLVYDDSDNSLDATGSLTYNATTGHYQYDFTPFMDLSKTYTANIDFGVSASTRYVSCSLSAGATGGGGLTTDEHNHLMGLSQFSGGNIVDRTKFNKELIEKIEEFEKMLKKLPTLDIAGLDKLLTQKIGTIKTTDISGIQTTLSNLLIEITAQKNLLIEAKNKEKQELIDEKSKLELEKQSILDKFDTFSENLKEKDSLLEKKQYSIEEKNLKISELEIQIKQIEMEKENEKQKAEETINELIDLHKGEIDEKQSTEDALVRAYLDKN